MGIFDKLLGKDRAATALHDSAPCTHTDLVPRWDSVQDMGERDKITSYTCNRCNAHLTTAEGNALRDAAAGQWRTSRAA
jgi:hypothetical protein